ncbi:MAG: hypothetical protein Q8P71_01395 [bacterium]|nr:hypothetical protein [bacterium]
MALFLYGQDTYRVRQELRGIIANHTKEQESSSRIFQWNGKEDLEEDLLRELRANSLFGGPGLFVIEHVFSHPEACLSLASLLKEPLLVVIVCWGDPPRSKLTSALLSNAECRSFPLLQGLALRSSVIKAFQERGVSAPSELVDLLVGSFADDPWSMAQEIQKLSLALLAGVRDWKLLVLSQVNINIFETIEAIARKQAPVAFARIAKHMENGDDPLYILSMLAYQFRLLLEAKTKKDGVPLSFPQRKALSIASRFSQESLKDFYKEIWEADTCAKTGKRDSLSSLFFLAGSISN